jgi:DNA repair exonuclease SbcCD ATPase subunit
MSQITQDRRESASPDTGFGADQPEPNKTLDLLTELRHCSGIVRQQIEEAHEQLGHIKSLCDELRAERSENDRLRAAVEDLRTQVTNGVRREDALRAEATAERHGAAAAIAARSDLERRLFELEDRLRTETEERRQLESEAERAARERPAEVEHGIAQKSKPADAELKAARVRIDQLTTDLHRASSANERLRSLLNVFGVVDHLESGPEPD